MKALLNRVFPNRGDPVVPEDKSSLERLFDEWKSDISNQKYRDLDLKIDQIDVRDLIILLIVPDLSYHDNTILHMLYHNIQIYSPWQSTSEIENLILKLINKIPPESLLDIVKSRNEEGDLMFDYHVGSQMINQTISKIVERLPKEHLAKFLKEIVSLSSYKNSTVLHYVSENRSPHLPDLFSVIMVKFLSEDSERVEVVELLQMEDSEGLRPQDYLDREARSKLLTLSKRKGFKNITRELQPSKSIAQIALPYFMLLTSIGIGISLRYYFMANREE